MSVSLIIDLLANKVKKKHLADEAGEDKGRPYKIKSTPLSRRAFISISAYSREKAMIKPENTMETVEHSLMRMFRLGPEVSLKGSPTVSPTTAALC